MTQAIKKISAKEMGLKKIIEYIMYPSWHWKVMHYLLFWLSKKLSVRKLEKWRLSFRTWKAACLLSSHNGRVVYQINSR